MYLPIPLLSKTLFCTKTNYVKRFLFSGDSTTSSLLGSRPDSLLPLFLSPTTKSLGSVSMNTTSCSRAARLSSDSECRLMVAVFRISNSGPIMFRLRRSSRTRVVDFWGRSSAACNSRTSWLALA